MVRATEATILTLELEEQYALRECTYKDFLNCQPLTFKGTEGVVVLSQWFEKMESVFHISNCAVESQVKFATYTFIGNALTWWNSHMKTVTQDVAYEYDSGKRSVISTQDDRVKFEGHHVFLAHVSTKEIEDKSGEKRLEDVPIVRDFPEVFPEDLSGFHRLDKWKIQIDLVHCEHCSYEHLIDWLPSEMKIVGSNCKSYPDRAL
ncbi:hypothetical protein Tco_0906766 [Tanacetum coccineum]|uniref:Retrotransposon gag domain-containing protein n=1 Tax=Tanacetum coccineum TaxID=301880 RepID=A0ABQ5CKT3_9ASTR